MSFYRILAVDYNGVVAAFVEHSEINAHNGSIVHTAGHSALIGRDYHYIVMREGYVGIFSYKGLQHLI